MSSYTPAVFGSDRSARERSRTDVIAHVCIYICVRACVCTLRALPRVLHYASSPGMDLMGREEKADEASPEAAYNVSNTWSAMSPGGHIGLVPHPSVSLLTSKCILGRGRGSLAHS